MKRSKFTYVLIGNEKYKEVIWMAKNVDVRNIVSNLSKLGIQAKITKSRVELIKAIALPQPIQAQSQQ